MQIKNIKSTQALQVDQPESITARIQPGLAPNQPPLKSIYQKEIQMKDTEPASQPIHTQASPGLEDHPSTSHSIRETRPIRATRGQRELSEDSDGSDKKKDKKLVFLSRSVLQCVRENPGTTGTQIAFEILELYKQFSDNVDFKNVQRRVYDALNVLSAMEIIEKEKNRINYNPNNDYIDDAVQPNTAPRIKKRRHEPQSQTNSQQSLQKDLEAVNKRVEKAR